MQKFTIPQFLAVLRELATHKDRYIKGHAKDLLTRLQSYNPQDETEEAHYCPLCRRTVYGNGNVLLLEDNRTICLDCKNKSN